MSIPDLFTLIFSIGIVVAILCNKLLDYRVWLSFLLATIFFVSGVILFSSAEDSNAMKCRLVNLHCNTDFTKVKE